ncbi:hypothetical protein [Methanothrix soehngenii]|jgi:hypothetical protein|uniref:hypothetical protein n=1 Tax=Methanothrix soehngenii TaxID=2223 RepID=UPI00300C124B
MAEEQQGGDSSQPRAGSWYSEKNLRPEVRKALDELEPKRGKEQRFYKEPPELKARVDKMIEGAKHISDPPKYKIGPVSEEEKLLAWHKAIGSSQRVIDFEIEELRKRKGGSRK